MSGNPVFQIKKGFPGHLSKYKNTQLLSSVLKTKWKHACCNVLSADNILHGWQEYDLVRVFDSMVFEDETTDRLQIGIEGHGELSAEQSRQVMHLCIKLSLVHALVCSCSLYFKTDGLPSIHMYIYIYISGRSPRALRCTSSNLVSRPLPLGLVLVVCRHLETSQSPRKQCPMRNNFLRRSVLALPNWQSWWLGKPKSKIVQHCYLSKEFISSNMKFLLTVVWGWTNVTSWGHRPCSLASRVSWTIAKRQSMMRNAS